MIRRRYAEAAIEENHDRWLLTYADMITLLVAFFIMLYGMSRLEQQKLDRFRSGVEASLGVGSGSNSVVKTEAAGDVVRPSLAETRRIRQRMLTYIRSKNLGSQVSIAMDEEGIVVRLDGGGMLFDTGTADLKPRTRELLDALFAAIYPELRGDSIRKIRVEGHTDNVPIRTAHFPSNWQLSTTRATNVVQYLSDRHPVLTSRLEAAGCAYMKPVASNATGAGRARNRRVEIRVLQRAEK